MVDAKFAAAQIHFLIRAVLPYDKPITRRYPLAQRYSRERKKDHIAP